MGKSVLPPNTGWWFGTFFIFPYIGNVIIPTDELIFLPPNIMGNFMHIFLRTLPRLKRRGTEVLTAAGKADAWWATLAMMEARGTINTFFGGKSYENG